MDDDPQTCFDPLAGSDGDGSNMTDFAIRSYHDVSINCFVRGLIVSTDRGDIFVIHSFIHSFIHLPNNAIEKKKCSNMYSRAGLQGKDTDSCPEITELHKNYTTNKN